MWGAHRQVRYDNLKAAPELLFQVLNQLLEQIEVETRRAAKTRVYGCLLTPGTTARPDAAEAARDTITLINHDAAVQG